MSVRVVIVIGAMFLASTTPTAMTDAFESLLSPFARFGLHTQETALVMSLALRFLPTLGMETKAIIDAQSARGGSVETGSFVVRIKAMVAVVVPVFAAAIRHADNLSLAWTRAAMRKVRRARIGVSCASPAWT